MPPLRVNAAALGDGMSRLNGRPGSSTNALRGGANGLAGARGSSPSRSNGEGVDILAVLKHHRILERDQVLLLNGDQLTPHLFGLFDLGKSHHHEVAHALDPANPRLGTLRSLSS